jgi:hypothetical protein
MAGKVSGQCAEKQAFLKLDMCRCRTAVDTVVPLSRVGTFEALREISHSLFRLTSSIQRFNQRC